MLSAEQASTTGEGSSPALFVHSIPQQGTGTDGNGDDHKVQQRNGQGQRRAQAKSQGRQPMPAQQLQRVLEG